MSGAKNQILSDIRAAIGDHAASRESEYSSIPRLYTRSEPASLGERLELFAERLREYDAVVYRSAASGISQVVAEAMASRNKNQLLIPPGLPKSWLPEGPVFIPDTGLTFDELDRSEGVVTGCAAAIALTGTIILRHTPEEGRRALTLIPDYHLCIVFASQVVDVVSEGITRMREWGSAPVTTISGPSATADIEMTRVKGVHGPRFLDVIIVEA